jgi:hypothetical protein
MSDISLTESSEVTIASADGVNKLIVNSDGSINVESATEYAAISKKLYVASFDFTLTSSGEKMVLYFRNPNASGKTITLVDATFGLTNTVSSEAIIRMYVNPTVTVNGTAVTVSPAYVGGSQAASVSLLTTAPTVTANGTQYFAAQTSGGANSNGSHYEFDQAPILAANNSLLFTGNPDGTNRGLMITLRWMEI